MDQHREPRRDPTRRPEVGDHSRSEFDLLVLGDCNPDLILSGDEHRARFRPGRAPRGRRGFDDRRLRRHRRLWSRPAGAAYGLRWDRGSRPIRPVHAGRSSRAWRGDARDRGRSGGKDRPYRDPHPARRSGDTNLPGHDLGAAGRGGRPRTAALRSSRSRVLVLSADVAGVGAPRAVSRRTCSRGFDLDRSELGSQASVGRRSREPAALHGRVPAQRRRGDAHRRSSRPGDSGARALPRADSLVAVKLGADGALAADGEASWPRSVRLAEYRAGRHGRRRRLVRRGVLAGFLSGWSTERALALGCACGGLSTRARSAVRRLSRRLTEALRRSGGRHVIVCVAGNPSVDKLFEVERLTRRRNPSSAALRAATRRKGIHVAQVATALGAEAVVTGLLAGHAGRWVAEALAAQQGSRDGLRGWPARPGRACRWRTGRPGASPSSTRAGLPVTADEWARSSRSCRSLLPQASWMTLAGSLPPGRPIDGYARLSARHGRRRVGGGGHARRGTALKP